MQRSAATVDLCRKAIAVCDIEPLQLLQLRDDVQSRGQSRAARFELGDDRSLPRQEGCAFLDMPLGLFRMLRQKPVIHPGSLA